MTVVHQLWIGGDLSRFERLSASSFVKNGYDVNLWTYGGVGNVPPGVTVRDAGEIIPESEIFRVRGSYAVFADIWRLAVLHQRGGMWADIDIVAVKPASELPQYPFFVTEDTWEGSFRPNLPWTLTNCIIHSPHPEIDNPIERALKQALAFPRDQIEWATIGPELLHKMWEKKQTKDFEILPVTFTNAIPAGEIVKSILSPGIINPRAHFVHLYNDMWRRAMIDKNTIGYSEQSILAQLMIKYYE